VAGPVGRAQASLAPSGVIRPSWLLVLPIVDVPAEPQLLLKVELPVEFQRIWTSWVHVAPPTWRRPHR